MIFFLGGWSVSLSTPHTLTIGLAGDQRLRQGIGDSRFSDDFESGGYITITQADRILQVPVASSNPVYGGRSFTLSLADIDPATLDTFTGGFDASGESNLQLLDRRPVRTLETRVGWTAEIAGIGLAKTPYRVWSGIGDLTLGGKKYKGTEFDGGSLAGISPIDTSTSSPVSRASVRIAVPNTAVRAMLAYDVGPVNVVVKHILSSDGGRKWIQLPTGISGRLSRPSFDVEGSIYSVEIETWSGDIDRGDPVLWSDEDQRARHPGDQGFEFARTYEDGIEVQWPT